MAAQTPVARAGAVVAFGEEDAPAAVPLSESNTTSPAPAQAAQDLPFPPEPPRLIMPKQEPSRMPLATTPQWHLLTDRLAKDCEFAHVYDPSTGLEWPVLASVSIVNTEGKVVYDTYVYHSIDAKLVKKLHPPHRKFGAVWEDLKPENGAQPFEKVCEDVRQIVQGRVVVGHAIINDTSKFPEWVFEDVETRDIQLYEPYREYAYGSKRLPRLGVLADLLLGEDIWQDGHTSVGDAKATMQLYMLNKSGIDAAQRDGYEVENRPWRGCNPRETDTEEEAIARVLRPQKQAIYAENQAKIDEAAAVKIPIESVTPFRHANNFWFNESEELKGILRSADTVETTASLSEGGETLTLAKRSLEKLEIDEKEWDGKLLIDDIGPEPVVYLPGMDRPMRPSDRATNYWDGTTRFSAIDSAWWLSASNGGRST